MAPISNRPGGLDRLQQTTTPGRQGGDDEADLVSGHTPLTPGPALSRELQRARTGREPAGGEGAGFELLNPGAMFGENLRPGGELGRREQPFEKKVTDLLTGPVGDGYEPAGTPDRGAGAGSTGAGSTGPGGAGTTGGTGQTAAPEGKPNITDLLAPNHAVFTDNPQPGNPAATRARGDEPTRERPLDEAAKNALTSAALLANAVKNSLQNSVSSAFAKLANLLTPSETPPQAAPQGAPSERAAPKESPVTASKAALAGAKQQQLLAEQQQAQAQKAAANGALGKPAEAATTAAPGREELRRAEIAEDRPKEAADPQAVRKSKEAKEGRDAKDLEHFLQGGGFEEAHAVDGADIWRPEQASEEEVKEKDGLRAEDVLGPQFRCHGTLDDGTRCLRRPVSGSSFCLEHFNRIVEPALELPDVDELNATEALDGGSGAGAVEEITSPRVAAVEEITSPGVPVAGSVITD